MYEDLSRIHFNLMRDFLLISHNFKDFPLVMLSLIYQKIIIALVWHAAIRECLKHGHYLKSTKTKKKHRITKVIKYKKPCLIAVRIRTFFQKISFTSNHLNADMKINNRKFFPRLMEAHP